MEIILDKKNLNFKKLKLKYSFFISFFRQTCPEELEGQHA